MALMRHIAARLAQLRLHKSRLVWFLRARQLCFIVLLLCLARPCLITFVQSIPTVSVSPGSSLQSGAFSSTPTNGNSILVFIWWQGSGADSSVSSVADNVAGSPNSYGQDATKADAVPVNHCSVYRAANITGGVSFKITVTMSGSSFLTFCAAEFSGLKNSSPLDGSGSTNQGTGGNPSTGIFSTSNANDLLIETFASGAMSAYTSPPTNFTGIRNHASNGADEDGAASYRIVASTQSNINPSDTVTTSVRWACIGLAYEAATGIPWHLFFSAAAGQGVG